MTRITNHSLDGLAKIATNNIVDFIGALEIQTRYELETGIREYKTPIDKTLTDKLLEKYLSRRGYTNHYMLEGAVMIKGFTCVHIAKTHLEVWHDKTKNKNSIFIEKSILTTLPITLNYMERI